MPNVEQLKNETHFNTHVIRLREVSVRRNGQTLINRLNWSVQYGERWAVLGTNGAGKSTLLHLLAARLYPTTGTVDLFGKRLGQVDVSTIFSKIGWISPLLEQFFTETDTPRGILQSAANGHIRLPAHMLQSMPFDVTSPQVTNVESTPAMAPEQQRMRTALWASIVTLTQIDALLDRWWGTLSSGEKKRVLLARALMGSPQLFIFDEATNGLDVFAREAWLKWMKEILGRDEQKTVVYVTHHSEEITDFFTHVLLIRQGEAFFAGKRETALEETLLQAFYDRPVRIRWHEGRPFIVPISQDLHTKDNDR